MNAPAEPAREVEAVRDGDWVRCGSCGTRIALGIGAVKVGARQKCSRCPYWNTLPIEEARP